MGRDRESAALVAAAVVASRILCSYCIPLANYSVTDRTTENCIVKIKTNESVNKIPTKIAHAVNESHSIPFAEVEYPSSSQLWDYYRFQNDYGNELKATKTEYTKTSSESKKAGWNVKKKRKYNASPMANIELNQDPKPQQYGLRKSDFFPKIEYPLSARDMWMPVYWNRHLGTENVWDTNTVEPTRKTNNNGLGTNETFSLNYISNKDPKNSKMGSKSVYNGYEKQEEIMRSNETSSVSKVNEIYSSTATTESLPMLFPMTITSEACISNNLFDPLYGTTVPLTPYEELQSVMSETIPDYNYSEATSSPFECLTPKLRSLYKETEDNFLFNVADTSIDELKSTTPSPSSAIHISTDEISLLSSSTESYLYVISDDIPKASSYNCLNNINDTCIYSSNESYITTRESSPEYCDEFLILVDNKKSFDPIIKCSTILENFTSDPAILNEGNAASNILPMTKLSNDSQCIWFDNTNISSEVATPKSISNSINRSDIDQKALFFTNDSYNTNELGEEIPTLRYNDDNYTFYTELPYDP